VDADADPDETREWLDALEATVRAGGRERGLFLLKKLEEQAQRLRPDGMRSEPSASRTDSTVCQRARAGSGRPAMGRPFVTLSSP